MEIKTSGLKSFLFYAAAFFTAIMLVLNVYTTFTNTTAINNISRWIVQHQTQHQAQQPKEAPKSGKDNEK